MAPESNTTKVCSVIGTGVKPNGILKGATAASNAANNAAKTRGLRLLMDFAFFSDFFIVFFFAIKSTSTKHQLKIIFLFKLNYLHFRNFLFIGSIFNELI